MNHSSLRTSSPSPGFKLRPRSNSHPMAEVTGYPSGAAPTLVLKPQHGGVHSISPDEPTMYPSARRSSSDATNKVQIPPPVFAAFFGPGSGAGACTSPIKKQKTQQQQDRLRLQLSPDSSPVSEDSCSYGGDSAFGTPPADQDLAVTSFASPALMFPPLLKVPSTPASYGQELPSSHGKRSLPTEEHEEGNVAAKEAAPSPFTPKGRKMMQNLCINSPTLSPLSPTPKSFTSSSPDSFMPHNNNLIHHPQQQLPNMPTFSFSPSLNKDRIIFPSNNNKGSSNRSKNTTADADSSSVRETIVFSVGSTSLGTPNRGSRRSSYSVNNNSPLNSLRGLHSLPSPGQRTPIGHQRGSVFKTLPPRFNPNGRWDDATTSSVTSVNSITCSSPFSTSASPRMVPLTVLSRDGSPMASPKFESVGMMPSPLLRSLDGEKNDSTADFLLSPNLNSDVKMPNISSFEEESPMSSDSHYLMPRIKLTPRSKKTFASARLGSSPGDSGVGLTMPRLTLVGPNNQHTRNIHETASSFVTDFHGDEEAAEMDSLLNGFEHHKQADDLDQEQKQRGSFTRVETELAEIASLTQGPHFQMPNLWPPPTSGAAAQDKFSDRCSLASMDGDASHSSPGDCKPMPSITLNLPSGRDDAQSSQLRSSSPSFLPRPVPISHKKSRSLFGSPNAQDPLESLIRADAIAEAARSNEPLSDEDTSMDGDDADFLLCLPQSSTEESESPTKFSKACHTMEKKIPSFNNYKSSHNTAFRTEPPLFHIRAESPLFNNKGSRNGSFMRRKCSDQALHGLSSPTTPTIFEEGFSTLDDGSASNRPFHPMPTHEGSLQSLYKREMTDATFPTFCSLSDCDDSEIMASTKYSRTSLLSMSSLCGLDIVHEASAGVAEAIDRVPVLLPSTSSEFSATMFKPMQRSELSLNSLGLSVDSADAGMEQRDLFTPPVAMGMPNSKRMLSPPPIRCRATSPLPFDAYQRWN